MSQSRRDVLELFDTAFLANGGGHPEWREDQCRCDPEVGVQCEYCAIWSALNAARNYVSENPPPVVDLCVFSQVVSA